MPMISVPNNCYINSENEIPSEYFDIIERELSEGENNSSRMESITPGTRGEITADEDIISQLLSDEDVYYFGHGTIGDDSVIDSILQIGLKVKDPEAVSGYFSHLRGLDSTTISLGEGGTQLFEKNKELLTHWPHLNSRRIVICALPKEFVLNKKYVNPNADFFESFYIGNDEEGFRLRPEFITGIYDADKQSFIKNENYYTNLSEEKKKEIIDSVAERYITSYADFSQYPPQENPTFPETKVDVRKATVEWYKTQLKRLRERSKERSKESGNYDYYDDFGEYGDWVVPADFEDWFEEGTTTSGINEISDDIRDRIDADRTDMDKTNEGDEIDIDGRE